MPQSQPPHASHTVQQGFEHNMRRCMPALVLPVEQQFQPAAAKPHQITKQHFWHPKKCGRHEANAALAV
jgi:hypothetical protein